MSRGEGTSAGRGSRAAARASALELVEVSVDKPAGQEDARIRMTMPTSMSLVASRSVSTPVCSDQSAATVRTRTPGCFCVRVVELALRPRAQHDVHALGRELLRQRVADPRVTASDDRPLAVEPRRRAEEHRERARTRTSSFAASRRARTGRRTSSFAAQKLTPETMAALKVLGVMLAIATAATAAAVHESGLLGALSRDEYERLSERALTDLGRLADPHPDAAAAHDFTAMPVGVSASGAARQRGKQREAAPRPLSKEQLSNLARSARRIVEHGRSGGSSFNLTFQPIDLHPEEAWREMLGINSAMAERTEAADGGSEEDGFMGEHAAPARGGLADLQRHSLGTSLPGSSAGGLGPAEAEPLDWVQRGAVPATVAYQGFCMSCWAFVAADAVAASAHLSALSAATSAAAQPAAARARSAQQFVSCDEPVEFGCTGGTPAQGLSYARRNAIASADRCGWRHAALRNARAPLLGRSASSLARPSSALRPPSLPPPSATHTGRGPARSRRQRARSTRCGARASCAPRIRCSASGLCGRATRARCSRRSSSGR